MVITSGLLCRSEIKLSYLAGTCRESWHSWLSHKSHLLERCHSCISTPPDVLPHQESAASAGPRGRLKARWHMISNFENFRDFYWGWVANLSNVPTSSSYVCKINALWVASVNTAPIINLGSLKASTEYGQLTSILLWGIIGSYNQHQTVQALWSWWQPWH